MDRPHLYVVEQSPAGTEYRNRRVDGTLALVEYDTNGGCWLWPRRISTNGYGVLQVSAPRKYLGAHRAVWERFNGPIPSGLVVRHKCDVRACVNPAHLEVGTLKDNSRDARERGRSLTGSRNPKSKLTLEHVLYIRDRHLAGVSYRQICRDLAAQQISITRQAVRYAARGDTWSHVQ